MEKLEDLSEGAPGKDAYYHLSRPSLHLFVEDTGLLFATGTLTGFLYHFIKGDKTAGSIGIKSRLYGAVVKSKRVGGLLALLSVATSAPSYTVYKLRGQDGHIPEGHAIASAATGSALVLARRGIFCASGAALAAGTFIAVAPAAQALTTRSLAKISETNTYSYPHYRRPQYHHTSSECN